MHEAETFKKTPLHDRHVALGGKMVNFAGWDMPVYYSGIIAEHEWTRKSCSFFDVSHLGEIHVEGPGAFQFLQSRLTNDMNKLKPYRMLYSLLCDEKAGVLDDILVYRGEAEDYYLIVNAASIEKDMQAILKYAPESLSVKNRSEETSCVAVQGPRAEAVLEKIFGFKLKDLSYYSFMQENFSGGPVWISRSGYTGEDGFEIFSMNALAPKIWDKLAVEGKSEGAVPAGLGARNTLRLEAGNALYGNDMDETTTPLEAGLGWAVSFQKEGGFVGRDRMLAQKENGLNRKLVGFKMLDKPVARENYPIFKDGKKIGKVTSGSFAPTAGCNIGLGYVGKGFEIPGTQIDIEIHGRPVKAEVVSRPFIELKHKK